MVVRRKMKFCVLVLLIAAGAWRLPSRAASMLLMRDLFGGEANVAPILKPTKVEAFRVASARLQPAGDAAAGKKIADWPITSGPVAVDPKIAAELTTIFIITPPRTTGIRPKVANSIRAWPSASRTIRVRPTCCSVSLATKWPWSAAASASVAKTRTARGGNSWRSPNGYSLRTKRFKHSTSHECGTEVAFLCKSIDPEAHQVREASFTCLPSYSDNCG